MKIRYSKEADALIIALKDGELSDSRDIEECIIVHLGKDNEPLEIEILDASKRTSLSELDITPKEVLQVR